MHNFQVFPAYNCGIRLNRKLLYCNPSVLSCWWYEKSWAAYSATAYESWNRSEIHWWNCIQCRASCKQRIRICEGILFRRVRMSQAKSASSWDYRLWGYQIWLVLPPAQEIQIPHLILRSSLHRWRGIDLWSVSAHSDSFQSLSVLIFLLLQ